MKTIRIGIDARMFSDNFTGIGRYTFELTERLFKKKTIKISGKTHPVEWIIFMNEPEFSVFDFPPHVEKICTGAGHYSLAEQTTFMWKLYRAHCDLVHFTHFNVPILYRKNFVVTIHDTTLSFFPGKNTDFLKRLLYKVVITNAVKASKNILTVSENTKKDIINIFESLPKKITCIWNGLTDVFRPISELEKKSIRKKYDLPEKYLFYSGVWREHKNIKGLIKAFSEVLKRVEKSKQFSDIKLVLTGKPRIDILDYAESLGILESIVDVQKVPLEDLVSLMGAAEAYVFPSFYEGFGLPPLEAMKAEIPVISSHTSAMPEVCGEAAAYFNPYDHQDMTDTIVKVLESSDLKNDLVKKGRSQIKKFSWDTCAEETFNIYESALQ